MYRMRNLSEEEKNLIERAKRTLSSYLGLSEPEAHRYIEKHAMDLRVTRVDVARGILKVYES